MKLETVRLEKLKPYENNPRENDHAVEEVKQSIEQVGYVTPIVVDEDYEILAGHTRYAALMEMGYESVECIVVDGLTDTQRRKFRLLDNKVGEISTWDVEMLRKELQGLDFGSYDGFAFLMEQEDDFTDVNTDFEEQAVYCPKCGELVE